MLNPSNTNYSFTWTNEDSIDGAPESANFRCFTPEGTVLSGKKYEMVFEYVPDSLDLVESFWRFFVPEHNISIPFVMVGHTFEPALSFDRSHINFREVLLGKASFLRFCFFSFPFVRTTWPDRSVRSVHLRTGRSGCN